jgi:hypothetical protein
MCEDKNWNNEGVLVVKDKPEIKIIGTLERILGTAPICSVQTDPYGYLQKDFIGGTEVDWDSQETITNARGYYIYMGDDGGEYPEDQLAILRPDGSLHVPLTKKAVNLEQPPEAYPANFNNDQAMQEGWLVIWSDSIGGLEIQRDDEAGMFKDDEHALTHVKLLADRGSAYHKQALDVIDKK